jgi:crossover junction endodeoxyribonuclease RuvC
LRATDCATPRPSNNGSGLTTPRTPASASNFLIKRDFIACFDLPMIGERVQRRVDAANLADLIREHGPYAFAIVQQVGARPGQGVSSMFRFGQAHGTILGVIGALAIPVRHVSPAKRKNALVLNSDGETSRARAIETWPAEAQLFARKRDHSRAEAALLGMYGLGRWPMGAGNTGGQLTA